VKISIYRHGWFYWLQRVALNNAGALPDAFTTPERGNDEIDPPCDLRNVLIENKLTVQDKTNELIDIYRTIIGKQIDIKI
jgi:hypothetical protein